MGLFTALPSPWVAAPAFCPLLFQGQIQVSPPLDQLMRQLLCDTCALDMLPLSHRVTGSCFTPVQAPDHELVLLVPPPYLVW